MSGRADNEDTTQGRLCKQRFVFHWPRKHPLAWQRRRFRLAQLRSAPVTSWLIQPFHTDVKSIVAQNDWPPCPEAFSVDLVRKVARGENADPLDEVPERISRYRIYQRMGLRYLPDALLLRREVISRLSAAEALLPSGLRFVVLDGWRTVRFQEELVAHYSKHMPSATRAGYVSDPARCRCRTATHHRRRRRPHVGVRGRALALGTDYDAFESVPTWTGMSNSAKANSTRRRSSSAISDAALRMS